MIQAAALKLTEEKVSEDEIVQACYRGNMALLRRWERRGIRVSSAEPLCQAAARGKLDMMRYLVSDLGADVNQADDQKNTPLSIASKDRHLAVIRCLVNDLSADVNQTEQDGFTPLHIAAQEGHLAVVRYLVLKWGADVNAETQEGATPLFCAAQNGYLAVLRCLVKKLGADVNHASADGATMLYLAASNIGHMSTMQCLVEEFGADVNQATHAGFTPLMGATSENHRKAIAYLLKHGADTKASTPAFGTAEDVSKTVEISSASAELIAYMEAKTHCSNLGCAGAGLKKCTGCKQVRYCGQQCQLAH
jgi:ankyrin repeat protein